MHDRSLSRTPADQRDHAPRARTAASRRLVPFLRRMRLGAVVGVVTLVACAVAVAIWGPIYGRFGWRVLTVSVLWLEALLLALLIEGLRPQNPYRHLDPRFSFLDRAPLTMQQNADTSDLWQAVPLLALSLLLLLSLVVV